MKFEWKKHGLIFTHSQMPNWACKGALTPTPFILNSDTVRVYCGFRDAQGTSRIGYVDLAADNPSVIQKVSERPVLDIGRSGCFDDSGVILGDIIRDPEGHLRMYYVGFQLVNKAKFLAFSGLAFSEDGEQFTRIYDAPVLDRTNGANMIRAIHTAAFERNRWRIWYAVGDDWQDIKGIPYPRYNIWHTESEDGLTFKQPGTLCVDNQGSEYRIGRPSVYSVDGEYTMFYTKGGTSGEDYFPGVATSPDGLVWSRQDEKMNLTLGDENAFDNRHLCYPRLFKTNNKTWAVYNGNNMGENGFGLMELVS